MTKGELLRKLDENQELLNEFVNLLDLYDYDITTRKMESMVCVLVNKYDLALHQLYEISEVIKDYEK